MFKLVRDYHRRHFFAGTQGERRVRYVIFAALLVSETLQLAAPGEPWTAPTSCLLALAAAWLWIFEA
jgi:hypothetical protein